MEITYLAHSGFVVYDSIRYYVFDAYEDPNQYINKIYQDDKEVWFFVTHNHFDHFSPKIAEYDSAKTRYFIHSDINLQGIKMGKINIMNVDDEIVVDNITIHMYGSTDAGGSFYVNTAEGPIFHAGDLNWWHWLGDTEENNKEARIFFEREMERIKGMSVDVAFFPVDARLEKARDWGITEWLDYVNVTKLLITMHHNYKNENDEWIPTKEFTLKQKEKGFSIWIPDKMKGKINV